jgi:hypothetical protein
MGEVLTPLTPGVLGYDPEYAAGIRACVPPTVTEVVVVLSC